MLSIWSGPYFVMWELVNPLPFDKILDWSKLKKIAGDILKGMQNEK